MTMASDIFKHVRNSDKQKTAQTETNDSRQGSHWTLVTELIGNEKLFSMADNKLKVGSVSHTVKTFPYTQYPCNNYGIQIVALVQTDVTSFHSDGIFSPLGHLWFGSKGTMLKLRITRSRNLR